MLPEDAFLRRLPIIIDLGQRLRLDGLVASSDMAMVAYAELCAELLKLPREVKPVSLHQTIAIALRSWAIVDNLHNYRQFAKRGTVLPGSDTEALIATTEICTELRNKMDHAHQTIRNNASIKGAVFPMYGFLTWRSPLREDNTWEIETVSLGTMMHKDHVSPTFRPLLPVPNEVGDVTLGAFGLQANLSALIEKLDVAIASYNAQAERVIVEQLTEYARSKGLDATKVLGSYDGRSRFQMSMKVTGVVPSE